MSNPLETLRRMPTAAVLEHQLRTSGVALIAGSETVAILERYSQARAHLAYLALSTHEATRHAVAAPTSELSGLSQAEIEQLVTEAAAHLRSLLVN